MPEYREIQNIRRTGTREQLSDLVYRLYDEKCLAEDSIGYYKAVRDGSWPNSVKLLEKWLARAKEKQIDNAQS